jgi:hypothetical protein
VHNSSAATLAEINASTYNPSASANGPSTTAVAAA